MKCEATTSPVLWWIPREIEFPRCSRDASIIMDGIYLCAQHAGSIALQKLIHMGMAVNLKKSGALCDTGERWVKHVR